MDDTDRVRSLLTRVADQEPAFVPPPVEALVDRSTPARGRPVLAVAAVVGSVVLIAVAVVAISSRSRPADVAPQSPRVPTSVSLTAPSTPQVGVAALAHYRWSALPTAPIVPRVPAAAVWTGTSMIVWGGFGPHDAVFGDGASYDPATRRWTKLPPAPLIPRMDAQSAWVDGSFVIWGGSNKRAFTDGAAYSPATGRWTKVPALSTSKDPLATLVAAGNRAILFTADSLGHPGGVIHAHAYDPVANTWEALPDLISPAGHLVIDIVPLTVGDTVLVWAYWQSESPSGQGAGADPYAYDLSTQRWSRTLLEVDPGKASSALLWFDGSVLLPDESLYCGMCSHPRDPTTRSVSIDPRTGRRETVPNGPLSTPNMNYFWTGGALLVVNTGTTGGGRVSIHPGITAAFDPITRRWSTVSDASVPASLGAVLWTGTRLLVWGEVDFGTGSTANAGYEFGPN